MRVQAEGLLEYIIPYLKEHFGNYEVVSAEEQLYEPIEGSEKLYKGFIDLVLKTKDGKYHVIDWKTCSWGWDFRRKTDRMMTYQLTFYKHFFSKKHNIDVDNIETHFALLKRTAKKNRVEIFRITSGNIKTNNALNILHKAIHNIGRKVFIKNRLSCKYCEFYGTEHCT